MVKNNKKTEHRVLVNTGLLVIMGIIFCIFTFLGLARMKMYTDSINYLSVSDSPNLCFEEQTNGTNSGAYICSTQYDENNKAEHLSGTEDYVIFLHQYNTFNSALLANIAMVGLLTIGSMATFGSLFGAVIYWNAKRG